MGYKQVFRYVAVKPIKAEHPIGSGTIVEYKEGDEFPGNDWGRAVDWLVENGKAVRIVSNVWAGPGSPEPAAADSDEESAEEPTPKPRRRRGGGE